MLYVILCRTSIVTICKNKEQQQFSTIYWCTHSEKHEIQILQSSSLTATPRSLLWKKPLRTWKLVHRVSITAFFWHYSNMIWSDTENRLLFLPPTRGKKGLRNLMTHTLTKDILWPPFNPGHAAEKRQAKERGKKKHSIFQETLFKAFKSML